MKVNCSVNIVLLFGAVIHIINAPYSMADSNLEKARYAGHCSIAVQRTQSTLFVTHSATPSQKSTLKMLILPTRMKMQCIIINILKSVRWPLTPPPLPQRTVFFLETHHWHASKIHMGIFLENCPIIIFFRVRHGPSDQLPQLSRICLNYVTLQSPRLSIHVRLPRSK